MPDGATFPNDPTELRLRLLGNGYQPVPIYPHDARVKSAGKRPIGDGWQRGGATAESIRTWQPGNTGLLTGELVGVDIDVLEPVLSERLASLAEKMLGPTQLVRIGRAPKTLLAYRTAEPGDKLLTPEMTLPFGGKAQVEILGAGQQFVAFGIHPDTRQHYLRDETGGRSSSTVSVPSLPKASPARATPAGH